MENDNRAGADGRPRGCRRGERSDRYRLSQGSVGGVPLRRTCPEFVCGAGGGPATLPAGWRGLPVSDTLPAMDLREPRRSHTAEGTRNHAAPSRRRANRAAAERLQERGSWPEADERSRMARTTACIRPTKINRFGLALRTAFPPRSAA